MRSVIKSTETSVANLIRAIGDRSILPAPQTQADVALLAARARIAELERAVADLVERHEAAQTETERAFERGREAGRAAGKSEAIVQDAERLRRLENAIRLARGDLGTVLEGTERLSLLIARDCLDVLLGETDYRSEVLTRLIRSQVAQTDQGSIVEIRVSQEDFPDVAAIERLCATAGGGRVTVVADRSFASGECNMTLILGQADIGLRQQWGSIRRLLSDMAEEGLA